jgi:hypothetical protein
MGDKKQPSLFDRPETIKQEIKDLPKETRQIIHRELYRFFSDETLGSRSDMDYEYRVKFAHKKNYDLMIEMQRRFSPKDLGTAIIYFLVEIEKNKKVYVYEKKGVRTFIKGNLLDEKRGKPLKYLAQMVKDTSAKADLTNLSPKIAELLKRNTGYGDGTLESVYLGILALVGTKSAIPTVKHYREKVEDGKFGHPTHVIKDGTAYPVTHDELEQLIFHRLKIIDDVLLVLLLRG